MNNTEELLKKRRKLGITHKDSFEEILIEPLSHEGMSELMRWVLWRHLFLPVIEY